MIECICNEMKKTARTITNAYEKVMAPSGLTTSQFALLLCVDHFRAIAVGDLAQQLDLDQTSTTRSVALLEKDGLLIRATHHDPRVKLVKLTDAGKRRMKQASGLWQTAHSHMRKFVSDEDWQQLTRILHQIETGAQSMGPNKKSP